MSEATSVSLVEQRHALRQRLVLQRLLLERQLGPATGVSSAYPRSITMRFIMQRPALAASLLMGLARLFKSK